jgi:D-galactarolactone cycloisomerase
MRAAHNAIMLKMRITNTLTIPLTSSYVLPASPTDNTENGVRNCVWFRVETDAGLIGWGEAYCGCYATEVATAALRRLSRCLAGKDVSDPRVALAEMRFENRYWAMRGVGGQCTSAVEAALWDIASQARQLPLWRLLGGQHPQPILAYASAGLVSLSPAEIQQEVHYFVEQGFRAYKICVCGSQTDVSDRLVIDIERVAAAREALGPDRLLFVDMGIPQKPLNWTFERAEAYLRGMAPYNIRFLEEPAMTYDVSMYQRLQRIGLVPIAGGESFCCPEEFEPFFAAGALAVVQPDAAVVGGPASCVEVIRRARECGVSVALHTWCAGVGIAQNLHAACSVTNGVLVMECPTAIHPVANEPIREIWHLDDGYIRPPSLPGLGVSITPQLLRDNLYRPDSERNY